MPNQPSWIDKVNFIRFWLENPCDFTWTVYFETAWAPIGRLAIRLVDFGLSELVRGRFAPAAQRQGRHGRKGRRTGKRRGAIPEVGNMIGAAIPAPEEFEHRKLSSGVRHLWTLDRQIQRHNYAWLILDGVGSFWYDWASGIVMDPRTSCPSIGRALFVNESHLTLAHGWGSMATGDEVYQQGPLEVQPFGVNMGSGKWMISQAAKVRKSSLFGDDATVQLGINFTPTPTNFADVSQRIVLHANDQATLITRAFLAHDSNFGVLFREYTSGDPCTWTEITTYVMQMAEFD